VYDATGTLISDSRWCAGGWRNTTGLLTGTYFAVATSPTYLDQRYAGGQCEGGCDPTAGTPISVTVGATTAGIDFLLVPAAIFADGFESGDSGAWGP
jgi:hypothetical protein